MLLLIMHYGFGAAACASVIGFIGFGGAAHQFLDPDRSLDDKLTTMLTPSRRARDFIAPGWRYQKLQWLSAAAFFLSAILFGVTGA